MTAAVVAGMSLLSCNSASKQAKEAAETEEKIAEASGKPIVLGPGDILEFGEPMPAPVVVDFWAEWCPPCKKFAPIFHKVAEKYKGQVRFISVDVDKCPDIAKQYGVESIPTILLVNTKGIINRNIGFMTEDELISGVEAIMPSTEPTIAPR